MNSKPEDGAAGISMRFRLCASGSAHERGNRPAAGRGKRMGMATLKRFLMLDGEILLAKTLRAFEESPEISEIILVTGEEWVTYCREEVVAKNAFRKVHKIIVGGARRHESRMQVFWPALRRIMS